MTRHTGCEIATLLCLLVLLAPAAGAQVTVVSGASFQPVVAPGSFASLFGSGLAPSVVVGSPGADGIYPKQLGGLTVTVGGAAADLVMVSPSQINFVVPLTVPFGTVNVFVADGLQTIAVGTASISPTAPALFTTDASGKGFGAILNGIDFSGAPFSLTTSVSGGGQVGTVIAAYGTGFRFAGGSSVSAQPGDVSLHVTASASTATGRAWSLPVLYAGPAPGYEGLDQINIQLPPDIDSNSDLTLTLFGDAVPANSVYLLLRRSSPPVLSQVSPKTASPGASVSINGSGYLDGTSFAASSRESAVFVLSDGTQIPAQLQNMTTQSAEASVPAAPVDSKGNFYYGNAQVCIVVDSQSACSREPFIISAPPSPTSPVGSALITFAQNLVSQTLALIPDSTDPGLRAFVTATAQKKLQNLQSQITAAANGTPETVQITDLNGNVVSVVMDLATIQKVEAILTASAPGSAGLLPAKSQFSSSMSLGSKPKTSQASSCGLAAELHLEQDSNTYSAMVAGQKQITTAGVDAFVLTAASACLGGIAGALALDQPEAFLEACIAATGPALAVEGEFDIAFDLIDYTFFTTQAILDTRPIFLQSLAVSPNTDPTANSVTLSPTAPTAALTVQGTAVSKSTSTIAAEIFTEAAQEAANELVANFLQSTSCSTCQNILATLAEKCKLCDAQAVHSVFNGFTDKLTSWVSDRIQGYLEKNYSLPALQGSSQSTITLGASSVSASASNPAISASLACQDGDASTVTLIASTTLPTQSITFRADKGNIQLLDPSSVPTAQLNVAINNSTPTVSSDRSSYSLTDSMRITGSGFGPGSSLTVSLQGIRTTATLINALTTRTDGGFQQSTVFPNGTQPGAYTVLAGSSDGRQSASTQIILKASPVAHFSMTANGHGAVDGGLLSLSVSQNASVNVSFDAAGSTASTGGSITKWVWQSNGGNLNCTSATCTLPFSTPSNSIQLTITDSSGQTAQATGQLNLTTVQPSGDFTVSTNINALSIIQGQVGTLTVSVQSSGGFQSSVRLSPTGLPAGATASFNPVAVIPAANGVAPSSLSITVSASTTAGLYALAIQGTADGYAPKSANVGLSIVVPPPGPTAHFKVTALGQTAQDGQTLTLQPTSTAPIQVQLDGSGSVSPGGSITSWLWASSGVPLACATSTCTANFAALTNAVTLTITDTNGKLSTATAQVNLTFPGAPKVHFSMSAQSKTANDGGTLNLSVPVGGNVDVAFTSSSTPGGAAITTYAWASCWKFSGNGP